ncbi:hypothetical protein JXZ79_25835, partial [Rhizobium cremeum]|uniref:hypothetical protein n=1 Tax=Rhizobium cremeum TaxID=2813827 RepID=UPI001FD40905
EKKALDVHIDLQSSFVWVWVLWLKDSIPCPIPVGFRRRTIHRLASEIENTKRRPSCNHQTSEREVSIRPSQMAVAERTQSRHQTDPTVYPLLRKSL